WVIQKKSMSQGLKPPFMLGRMMPGLKSRPIKYQRLWVSFSCHRNTLWLRRQRRGCMGAGLEGIRGMKKTAWVRRWVGCDRGRRTVTSAAKAAPIESSFFGAAEATLFQRGFFQQSVRPAATSVAGQNGSSTRVWGGRKRHWDRMDQALRAMDLLMQAGGFGAI